MRTKRSLTINDDVMKVIQAEVDERKEKGEKISLSRRVEEILKAYIKSIAPDCFVFKKGV